MATDRHNEDDSRSLARCAACNATVIAQIDRREPADANIVCATCGMTLVDPPFEGGDYFDLIMRVHPRPAARRPRR
jgi:DNA-directed RNA polymerase subunit RPC12/RpoP